MERVKEILTPKSLLDTLEMDFNDHAVPHTSLSGAYSQEDVLFLKKVERGVRFVDGHYEIPLPFRKEMINLPNTQQAVNRKQWQKRKMQQNTKYCQDYVAFVENVIAKGYAEKAAKGYAEKAPMDEVSTTPGNVWYISHHGLYHPKKPNKIRVVFDCSARFLASSLNDHLLPGPNLTNTLIGVLSRFRQKPYAFMADIESMF